MADASMDSVTPEPQRKKRKLRFPRTSQACDFCRKRKIRCSGNWPCEMCVREENTCEYARTPGRLPDTPKPDVRPPAATVVDTFTASKPYEGNDSSRASISVCQEAAGVSRRSSIDPPQTFLGDNHIGPTSGVSFLYGQWGEAGHQRGETGEVKNFPKTPLISWGDIPQPDSHSTPPELAFATEQLFDLLDRYFQYVSPTYRFLHHPTVKRWAVSFVSKDVLPAAPKACLLLICAQTLLHGPETSEQQTIHRSGSELSMTCFEEAKVLLDKESGPPSLTSVQARIGMCLYLLSTFRLNECRYCFSFAVTVATTLGLHRKQSSTFKVLEAESRSRTFWSLYVLDGYLGVMLGRPRLLRDEDIDQPFPSNISDHDLTSDEVIEDLPQHGNLEAAIAHAKLARLMSRGNDQLYPLHSLSNDQILQQSNAMLEALEDWQKDLPTFLQAREKTLMGHQTFARQNTILKLAFAHVKILATRRCLLIDFTNPTQRPNDARAKRCIQECVTAINMILDTVQVLIEHGQCFRSLWSTQYIALVAISTLYVLIIQGVHIDNHGGVECCVAKARPCHDHLATLPPAGSQAERHLVLLSHLRSKAERSLSRREMRRKNSVNVRPSSKVTAQARKTSSCANDSGDSLNKTGNIDNTIYGPPATRTATLSDLTAPSLHQSLPTVNQDAPDDMSMFGSMLTPHSSVEDNFQYMLDFGWESLDIIGASTVKGDSLYGFQGM